MRPNLPCLTSFFGIIILTPVSAFIGPSSWTHELKLEEGFEVKWIANDPYFLVMEMSAPTIGYVGLGFSPTGGMKGSDIVIGWVDSNGVPHLQDFHAEDKAAPFPDVQQDYELIAAEEKDNMTTVRFRRRWETCDENHDMIIGNDTMRLIWAWHPEDPEISNKLLFKWHGAVNRGVKSVYMRSPPRPTNFPDELTQQAPNSNVKNWDLTMNNIYVDNKETTYMCRILRFPMMTTKHHMIGFRPLISEGNRENVHHMSVYHCQVAEHLGGTQAIFDKYFSQEPGECYSPNMPSEWTKHCFTFLFSWAVGSEGEMFPDHVGSPLGGPEGDATYFKLEIHYDNPTRRTFVDSSGLRVFYTDVIRPFEATTLFLGHRITPFQMIPYGQEAFHTYSFCPKECTENGINRLSGLRVFSVMLHAHLSGRKIKLRHIRKGKELPPIAEDNNYDFNYQQFRILNNEVIIMPGDELLVECEYETLSRDRFVFGGPDAEQEMCQAILFYYPRSNLTDCRSQPEFYSFFKTLDIDNVTGTALEIMKLPYDGNNVPTEYMGLIPPDDAFQLLGSEQGGLENPFDVIGIVKPNRFNNQTVGYHMRTMRWSDKSLVRKVEKNWRNGLHYTFCAAPAQRKIFTREHTARYPKFREYKDGAKSSCRGRIKEKQLQTRLSHDEGGDDDNHGHGNSEGNRSPSLSESMSINIIFNLAFLQVFILATI